MKIAIDIRNIGKNRTGDETVFFHLVRELVKIDTENEYFLCIDRRGEGEVNEIRERLGVAESRNFHIKQFFSGNKFWWNGVIMPGFLRKENVDVYHTQYIVPMGVPKRVKIVTHVHDVSFQVYPQFISPMDRFFLAVLMKWSLRRADAIVAVSDFTASEIVRCYGEAMREKLYTIHNAVHDSADTHVQKRVERVRKKYHLPEKYILYVGTHQPRKNVPFLLKAFDRVARRADDTALVITGKRGGHNEDPEIEKVLCGMRHADRVIFPGYVDAEDLSLLYAGARVFAQPSFYEGFDLPILEAMAQGTIPVLSDIPVHREVVGSAAAYADPGDVELFSKVLYDTLTDEALRASLSREGVRRRGVFSWPHSAGKLLALYQLLKK